MQNPKIFLDDSNSTYRTMRASLPIKKGELIYQTDLLTHSVWDRLKGKICDSCLNCKGNLLKCAGCSYFYYCNEECQKNDWLSFHKEECKKFQELNQQKYKISNEFVLYFRIFLFFKKNEELRKHYWKVKSHSDFYSEKKLQEFKEIADKIIDVLGESEEMKDILFNEILKIQVNFFTIERPSYITNNSIGIGFYSNNANFLNHSCSPNAFKIFVDKKLKIYSSKDIDQGAEIFICYDENLGKPYAERQEILKKLYNMICQCSKCLEEGKIDNLDRLKLICKKCLSEPIENNNCKKCEKSFEPLELVQQYNDLEKTIRTKIFDEKSTLEDQLKFFEEAMKKFFREESPLTNLFLEKMISLHAKKKEYEQQVYKILKIYVKNYNKWFDIEIPSLWFKYIELSKIAFSLKKGKKSKKFGEKALQELNVYFESQTIEEIEDLKLQLKKVNYLLDTGNELKQDKNKNLLKID